MALTFQSRARRVGGGDHARRPGDGTGRVAIMPGAWNPPTLAHLAVARAARGWAEEVVLTLPRSFPHKGFEGAGFEDRIDMLRGVAEAEAGLSVAVTESGYYFEIAGEAADYFGPKVEIGLVCGRDAAERIAAWDYGRPGVFEEMVRRYTLLVAARSGEYVPSPAHGERIVRLPMEEGFSGMSSTLVRNRVAAGEAWAGLVPESIVQIAGRIYNKGKYATDGSVGDAGG